MSFQQGLSGLNTSSKALDVIGNNISNSSTVGFKSAETHFADVYANSLSGGGASQVGIGSSISGIQQAFSQGNITATNNPLDISINGNGFFRMSNSGAITYTRNGQFHLDNAGYIINDQGMRLTGYQADANGGISPSSPVDIQLSASQIQPRATSDDLAGDITANLNLDSRQGVASDLDPTAAVTAAAQDVIADAHAAALATGATTASIAAAAAATAATYTAGSPERAAADSAVALINTAKAAADAAEAVSTAAHTAALAGGATPATIEAAALAAAATYTVGSAARAAADSVVSAINTAASATGATAASVDAAATAASGVPVTRVDVAATSSSTLTTAVTAGQTAAIADVTAGFDPAQPGTYNYSTALSVYDTLGVAHTMTLYFQRQAAGGAWNVFATMDGANPQQLTPSLTFNTSGVLTSAMPVTLPDWTLSTGARSPWSPGDINFTGTTQYGSASAVDRMTQGGFTTGSLSGLSVGSDGVVIGRYSNGQARNLGQVVLATFANPNGLQSLGNNQWSLS